MAVFSLKAKLQLRNPGLVQQNAFYSTYYDLSTSLNYFDNIIALNDQNIIIGNIVKELIDSLKQSPNGKNISSVSLFDCSQTSQQKSDYECQISIQMNNQNDTLISQLKNDISNCTQQNTMGKDKEKYCFLPPRTLISQNTKPMFESLDVRNIEIKLVFLF